MDDTGYPQVQITLIGFLQSGPVVQEHLCEQDEGSAPVHDKCARINSFGVFFGQNSLTSLTARPQNQLCCLSCILCTAGHREMSGGITQYETCYVTKPGKINLPTSSANPTGKLIQNQ